MQMISQGLLKDIPRAFALHCDPKVDLGQIGTRIGAITSASDTVKIHLSGHGGHTSRPHLTEDLIYAMSQIAVQVPAVLTRRTDVRSGVLWHGARSVLALPLTLFPPRATWRVPCVAWTF